MPKPYFAALFHKEHSFRNAENNNKKARKLGANKNIAILISLAYLFGNYILP